MSDRHRFPSGPLGPIEADEATRDLHIILPGVLIAICLVILGYLLPSWPLFVAALAVYGFTMALVADRSRRWLAQQVHSSGFWFIVSVLLFVALLIVALEGTHQPK